ncbi:MAG: STING domain-containing protein [Limisphaerales bacterium]
MPANVLLSRCRMIFRAWPPAGAVFLLLSFLVTAVWLCHAFFGWPGREMNWLEPLAAILAGTGAFVLAAILIFRRVDCARAQADTYGLARGLATGYYFNFLRPLVGALRDVEHSVHAQVAAHGGHKVSGVVVGIPQSVAELMPEAHNDILHRLTDRAEKGFQLIDLEIAVPGRPRPLQAKAALSRSTKSAVVVDIPTTLSVIGDFAGFLAREEGEAAGGVDERVVEARTELVASSQTGQFQEVLSEFLDVVNKVGAQEARPFSPAALLHLVPLHRLRRRVDELADH